MKWRTYLALGRVSNLPTVWSNVLAGIVLSGAELASAPSLGAPAATRAHYVIALTMLALSLFYVGGMFLNDAFDRDIDARIHPERPIPSGRVSAGEVFAVGFGLMIAGVMAVGGSTVLSRRDPLPALAASMLLGGLIVVYDRWHKGNPLGPLLMGACRMLVYVSASLAVSGSMPSAVVSGSLCLLAYLIGLTYVAKQETLTEFRNFWPLLFLLAPFAYVPFAATAKGAAAIAASLLLLGFLGWVLSSVALLRKRAPGNIPRAVVRLIAGISLLDTLFLASQGHATEAVVGVGCFGATLLFQRFVRGT
ncbi:MAG TPA: UbiA family prenyltransferase [Polyangiaceae bacterium]|nr:UbiA family prenyltransferase [Polyangiaceae bacterium]